MKWFITLPPLDYFLTMYQLLHDKLSILTMSICHPCWHRPQGDFRSIEISMLRLSNWGCWNPWVSNLVEAESCQAEGFDQEDVFENGSAGRHVPHVRQDCSIRGDRWRYDTIPPFRFHNECNASPSISRNNFPARDGNPCATCKEP